MIFNPFLAQRLAEAYIQEARREAEQDRMVRTTRGGRDPSGRPSSVILALSALLGLIGRGDGVCR